ncbi:MAG TPA: lysozyme [Flavobacterium sp.]|nr:lysozyme [Flavobacterium sp.]
MKTSQIGIDLIKHFEGLHDGDLKVIGLQPKMCPAGIWTEGYGRAMRDKNGKFIRGIENKKLAYSRITIKTEEQAQEALRKDLIYFEKIVLSKLKVPVKQQQFDALVSHTYNTGGSDTLFRLVNNKSPKPDIKYWFENKYITGGGKKLKGLVERRKAESKLYFYE